jgi:hypothetical protein
MIEQAVMSKNTLTNHRFPCITLLSLVRLDKGFSNGHAAKFRRFSYVFDGLTCGIWRQVLASEQSFLAPEAG